ncbi:MAG: hypothetical protein H6604_01625 [Flavobacteriales bacterium]|nr:hypothetical protein [Flavobacteriales bacterium]
MKTNYLKIFFVLITVFSLNFAYSQEDNQTTNPDEVCEWCLPDCELKYMVNLGDGTWCCNKKGNENDCSKKGSSVLPTKNTNSDSISNYLNEYKKIKALQKDKLQKDVAQRKNEIHQTFLNKRSILNSKREAIQANQSLSENEKNKQLEGLNDAERELLREKNDAIQAIDAKVNAGEFYAVKTIKSEARNGFNKYTYSNGDVYEGNWVENKKQGFGKYTSASTGDVYEGNWVDDIRSGQGKLTWKDGKTFVGNFENNMPKGEGKMIYADGTEQDGVFENGIFKTEVPTLDYNEVQDIDF